MDQQETNATVRLGDEAYFSTSYNSDLCSLVLSFDGNYVGSTIIQIPNVNSKQLENMIERLKIVHSKMLSCDEQREYQRLKNKYDTSRN